MRLLIFNKKLCSQIHLTYLKNSKLRQAFGKKNLSSCLNQSLLIAVSCDGETIQLIKKYGHIQQKAQTTLQEQDRGNVEFHGLEAYSEGHQVGRCREKTADSSSRETSPFRPPLGEGKGDIVEEETDWRSQYRLSYSCLSEHWEADAGVPSRVRLPASKVGHSNSCLRAFTSLNEPQLVYASTDQDRSNGMVPLRLGSKRRRGLHLVHPLFSLESLTLEEASFQVKQLY